ncbi:MAG: DUF4920 domain-containing protein [Acidobacteriota bacterium]|nr:DUF4920 domain-containing protein [Blastocatellia bacterium]MDW8239570.1 DUF4920 domain-containing protein [Acidobacteriota bacterium]
MKIDTHHRSALAVRLVAIILLLIGSVSHQLVTAQRKHQADARYQIYGAKPQLDSKPLTLAEALQPANLNKPIRIEAKIAEVCQMKGCWMVLVDGEHTVRVTFKDYGFFVPKNSAGRMVIVEGQVSETTISEAQARHYAEDAGKSKEEIEKIVGDQKGFTMVASSVMIRR